MVVSSSRISPSPAGSNFPWHLVLLLGIFVMVLLFGFFGVSILSSHGQATESVGSQIDSSLLVSKPQLRSVDANVAGINSTKDVAAVNAPSTCDTVELEVSSTTGTGKVTMKMHHDWAPLGAARFCELVEKKFYDDVRFFRVLKVKPQTRQSIYNPPLCSQNTPWPLVTLLDIELHGANRYARRP
jgi:hypothetical protein